MVTRRLAAIFFLDVVDSTPSMATDEDGTHASLTRLRHRASRMIGDHGGRVIKGTGDGLFAEFPSALAATRAAIEIQTSDHDQRTGNTDALRFRIGINLADVIVGDDGDLYGDGVNIASRIEAAAEPGGVCISEFVHAQIATKVDIAFVGPENLYVGNRPIRVWKTDPISLQAKTVAAQNVVPSPHVANAPLRRQQTPEIPRYLSSFIGRDSELNRVGEALEQHRIVRLTGQSGVGKTRLAVEAAQAFVQGRKAYIEIVRDTSKDSILPLISSAFGIVEDRGRPLQQSLVRTLQDAPLLLVIDNVEGTESNKRILEFLLREVPGLRILTTGLGSSGVAGERVIQIPPLDARGSDSDALELFLARTGSIDVEITSQAELEAAARLCQALDGIPLAIEFAAARARLMPVASIVENLDDHLKSLRSGWGTSESKHRTLSETVDWSFGFLSDDAKRTACLISLFPGGIDFEDLNIVAQDVALITLFDALEELVDSSFIRYGRDGRYQMYDTTASFVRPHFDALSVKEASAIDWALDLAQHVSDDFLTPSFEASMHRAYRERDNIRSLLSVALEVDPQAALEIAAGLARYWLERLEFTEGQSWLETAAALNPANSSDAMVTVLASLGRMQFQTGSLREGLRIATQSVELTMGDTGPRPQTQAEITLASILAAMGSLPQAYAMLTTAATRLSSDEPYLKVVLHNIASVAVELGEFDSAKAAIERSQSLGASELGIAPWTDAMQARLAIALGQLDQAEAAVGRYRTWANAHDIDLFQASAAVDLAAVALLRRDFSGSHRYLDKARQHLESEPSPEVMRDVHITAIWAETLRDGGQPMPVIREAITRGLETPDGILLAHASMAGAVAHAMAGSFESAAEFICVADAKREETQVYVNPMFAEAFSNARTRCRESLGTERFRAIVLGRAHLPGERLLDLAHFA
jgi:predicted ATPase/class 3 adenylate cyclase